MKRRRKSVLAVLTLVSFSPILVMLASSAIASLLHCTVDEGARYPCFLGGIDIGGALQAGFVSAWFMFVTWPGMLVCAVAWAFFIARWLVRRLRRIFRQA